MLAFSAVLFFSCAGGPVNIPQDISPAEIIQRAQEASDKNRFKTAQQYYETLLERYPDDINMVCTAEYEIAFIHYKQKNYSQAREELNTLLERYGASGGEDLPPSLKSCP